MAKKKLPRGIREKGNGSYEARATVNGTKISICGKDLEKLIIEFDSAKEQAKNGMNNIDITLNEWFEQWFENVKKHRIKETSIAPMKNSFKRTFGFYIGTMRLRDIKPLDVQQAVNAMEKAGFSNSSMRDALGRLRECMEFAIGNQLITYNPCLIVEVPWVYKQSKEEIALTQEEQNAMLDEVEDSWYKEMFYFLCLTGVRVGELGGLKWEDIDFNKKVISIRRSLSCTYCNGEKKEILTTPKTVNSMRDIPFIGEMEEILISQREKQNKLRKELGKRWRGPKEFDGIVFTTGMGSPCSRYIVDKEIKKVIKRMREKEAVAAVQENRVPNPVRDFHPHTLRHTFATRCFENKMEPKIVQTLMGHASISITLNIYTHVLDSKMNDEIKKFGSAKTTEKEEYYLNEVGLKRISAHSHY